MGGSRGRRGRREVKRTGRNGYRLNNPPTSPSPCPPLLPPPRPHPPHMPPPSLLRPPLRTRPTRRRGGRSLWKTANKLSIASAYLYVNNTIATCPPPVCLSTCLSVPTCLSVLYLSVSLCLSVLYLYVSSYLSVCPPRSSVSLPVCLTPLVHLSMSVCPPTFCLPSACLSV